MPFTPLGPDYFERLGKLAMIQGGYDYENPYEEGTMPYEAWKAGFAKEYEAYLVSISKDEAAA